MIEYGFFDSELTGYDEEGLPVFDRAKSSEFFAEFWKRLVSNGVLGEPADCFQVVSTGGMNISVKPGFGFILGHYVKDEEPAVFVIKNTPTGKRIDLVILRLNRVNRLIEIFVKEGIAANEPEPPELVREEYGDYFELCLAKVLVDSTSLELTQSSITDTRMDSEVCGIVTCPIDHLDTSVYYQQIQTYFEEFKGDTNAMCLKFERALKAFYSGKETEFTAWYNSVKNQLESWCMNAKNEFDSWFDSVKGQLEGDVAANLAGKVAELEKEIDTKAGKSVLLPVTIFASAWTGEKAPFTARISLDGITGSDQELIEVFVQYEASQDQKETWADAGVIAGDNIPGAILLEAFADKPEVDIPIYVLKRGDLGDSTGGSTAACDCTPITTQQISEIVSGDYTPEEENSAICRCVPISKSEVVEIVEG